MRPLLPRCRLPLVVLALAFGWALAAGPVAVAQETQTPTELWEEYPLAPEVDRSKSTDTSQPPDRSRGDAPARADDSGSAASDDGSFPLLQVVLALGLLLLVLAVGAGLLPRDARVPTGLRRRFDAMRNALPQPNLAAAYIPREPREVTKMPGSPLPSTDRSKGSDRAGKPPSAPRPKPPTAARKPPTKPAKPPTKPAKPPRAVKREKLPKPIGPAKPGGAAKPPERAKPASAARVPKPARSAKPKPSARIKPRTQTSRGKRSASPRPEPRPVEEQPPVAQREPSGRTLTCAIYGWRDGQVADFYAVAFGLQGRDWIVERSPRFLWPTEDVPDEAYVAHAILVNALVRAGWRLVGREGVWYRQVFERAIEPASERR
jgi:hypothetical protein